LFFNALIDAPWINPLAIHAYGRIEQATGRTIAYIKASVMPEFGAPPSSESRTSFVVPERVRTRENRHKYMYLIVF
jgi:hypothetical protein